MDLVIADSPFVFEYERPNCSFALPPGLLFSACADDYHITNAKIFPELHFLNLNDALVLTSQLSATVQKSGWKLSRELLTPAQVTSEFSNPNIDKLRLSEWVYGDDELYLDIERDWHRGQSLPKLIGYDGDLFLVSIKIENAAVRKLYPGHSKPLPEASKR